MGELSRIIVMYEIESIATTDNRITRCPSQNCPPDRYFPLSLPGGRYMGGRSRSAVSVAMLAYNRRDYVDKAIESG